MPVHTSTPGSVLLLVEVEVVEDPMTDLTTDPTDATDLVVVMVTVEVELEVASLLANQAGVLEPLDPTLPVEEVTTHHPDLTMTRGITQTTVRMSHRIPNNQKD